MAKERVRECVKSIEIIQSEEYKEKPYQRKINGFLEICGTISGVLGILKREESKTGAEKII